MDLRHLLTSTFDRLNFDFFRHSDISKSSRISLLLESIKSYDQNEDYMLDDGSVHIYECDYVIYKFIKSKTLSTQAKYQAELDGLIEILVDLRKKGTRSIFFIHFSSI